MEDFAPSDDVISEVSTKDSTSSLSNKLQSNVQFKLLQKEIAVLKEELKSTEHSYVSKRALLEEEAEEHRVQYRSKVAQFQNKFAVLAEETRAHEVNYQTEVSHVKEQLRFTEQTWHNRLDQLEKSLADQTKCRDQEIAALVGQVQSQTEELSLVKDGAEAAKQSMSKEYVMLHMQFENLAKTSEKRMKETETARLNFDKARVELIETLSKRQASFEQLQHAMVNQASDLQSIRNEAGADKEELELMIQSWITQHEQLNIQVQQHAQELKVVKEDMRTATDDRDCTRKSVQKLGQTWETLFEHLVEQVQDHAEEQRTFAEHHDVSHQALKEKIDTHNTVFDDKLLDIELRSEEQRRFIGNIRATSQKHTSEIASLQQATSASDVRIAALQTQSTNQAKDLLATRTDLDEVQTEVEQLSSETTARFDRLEANVEAESKDMASVKASLLSKLEEHGGRVKAVDSKIVVHTIQLGEIADQIKKQKDGQAIIERRRDETHDETRKLLQTQKSDLDALSTKLQEHADEQEDLHEAVQVALKDRSDATALVSQNVFNLTTHVTELEQRVEQHGLDHQTTRGDFETGHTNLGQIIEERIVDAKNLLEQVKQQAADNLESTKAELVAELKLHQSSLTFHDAKLTTFGPQIQQLVHQVGEHDKELLVATEDRGAIRQEMEQLTQAVNEEDTKLRSQIDEQAIALNGKLGELHSVLDQHDERHQALQTTVVQNDLVAQERHETAIHGIEGSLEAAETRFVELRNQVQEHAAAHEATNADCALLKDNLLKLAEEMKDQSKTIALKIEEHVTDLRTKHGVLSDGLTKQVEEQRDLDLKLEEYNEATKQRHESSITELQAKMNEAQSKFVDLSSKVDAHQDDLNISKEARVVIRQDLKTLMSTMNSQDGAMRKQIEETAVFVNEKRKLFKSMLTKLEARQSSLDKKIELFNAASKEQNDRLSQECATQIVEVKKSAEEQARSLETRVDTNARSMVEGQNSLLHEFTQKQSDALMKATAAMHTTLNKHRADKADIEKKLETFRTSLSEAVGSRVQAVESKLVDCKSQFEHLVGQVETHADKSNSTKSQVDLLKEETERLTEIQMTQFEHLLTQLNQQTEELVSVKAVIPSAENVGIAVRSAEDIQALAGKLDTLMQEKEVVSSEARNAADAVNVQMESRMNEVQEQLQQLQASLENIRTSRDRPIQAERSTMDEEREPSADSPRGIPDDLTLQWSEQLANAVAQIQQQAAEMRELREDRVTSYADTNARVEQLQHQLETVTGTMARQASDIEREREERNAMQMKLKASLSENAALVKKVSTMKSSQQKYKSDFRKRQGLIKALMADDAAMEDVPRDVCFSISEEGSRATTDGSFHSQQTCETRE